MQAPSKTIVVPGLKRAMWWQILSIVDGWSDTRMTSAYHADSEASWREVRTLAAMNDTVEAIVIEAQRFKWHNQPLGLLDRNVEIAGRWQ